MLIFAQAVNIDLLTDRILEIYCEPSLLHMFPHCSTVAEASKALFHWASLTAGSVTNGPLVVGSLLMGNQTPSNIISHRILPVNFLLIEAVERKRYSLE